MKKVLLLLAAVVLVGCTKDELPTVKEDCGCNPVVGVMYPQEIQDAKGNTIGTTDYFYKVKDNCTGITSDWINGARVPVKLFDCK